MIVSESIINNDEYYNKLISACQGVSIRPCKYV